MVTPTGPPYSGKVWRSSRNPARRPGRRVAPAPRRAVRGYWRPLPRWLAVDLLVLLCLALPWL
ncbi:MAG: hypothetical protein U0841_28020 [Chloroflexia bacterium]